MITILNNLQAVVKEATYSIRELAPFLYNSLHVTQGSNVNNSPFMDIG